MPRFCLARSSCGVDVREALLSERPGNKILGEVVVELLSLSQT